MNTNETKNKLHQLIDESDVELTNVLMEVAVEYKAHSNIEIAEEWIDEAIEIDRKVDSGEMKTYTLEEHFNTIDAIIKLKQNVV